jgi:hypothetical protein
VQNNFRVRPAFAAALLASTISLTGLFAGAAQAVTYLEYAPPDTVLTSGPATLTNETSAAFAFSSTKVGVTRFQCSLDHTNFVPCVSPRVYSALGSGLHSFEVSAVDAWGEADPSPAAWQWTVASNAIASPKPGNPKPAKCKKGFRKAKKHGKTVCLKKKHHKPKHR